MRILLIQEDNSLRDRVGFWLENSLQAEIATAANTADAAIEIREGERKVDLVIFDFQKSAIKSYRLFREEVGKTLPIILCLEGLVSELSGPDTGGRTQIVNRRNLIEGIAEAIVQLKTAGALSEPSSDQEGETETGDEVSRQYVRIRSSLLLSVIPLKGDIYIRLSAAKFVKLFREGDEFNREDFQKYAIQKGVEYLYLKRESVEEFLTKYTSEIRRLLKNVNDLRLIGQSEVSVHELSSELLGTIGFTPSVERMVRTQMQVTVKALEKTPKLRDILAKLDNLKGDYLPLHSTLTGHIACGLATEVSWSTNLTFQKLTMAAFLHDITLDDGKMARIRSLQEFNSDFHGAEAMKKFAEHPARAAELANQFHEVPPDVDKVILQHHEMPDQSGFPHKIGATRMYPLACLFIVAHELARYQIDNREKSVTVHDFIRDVGGKYDGSQFRKLFGAVVKCFETPA